MHHTREKSQFFFLKKGYCSVLRNVTFLFIAISDTAFSITIHRHNKQKNWKMFV